MSSALKLSLRSFDDGVQRAYARLFAGDPDKSPALLDWRFNRNPQGRAKFAVATDGDDVVGMIALVPTQLRSRSGEIMGYQAIDTMVDPGYRGHGLFVKLGALAQDAERLGGEVLWGFPNANAAPGWYGRLGWRNFGAVPMMVRPLRTSFLLGRVHHSLGAVDVPLIGKAHEQFEPVGEGAFAGFDALWSDVAQSLGTSVERSSEWLRWRLVNKPGADYRSVAATDSGKLQAMVVSKVAEKHGARLCYVMDALAGRGESKLLSRVLHSELANAAAAGAEAALAWCPAGSPSYSAYRKAGFLPFPAWLRPIEINFGARALSAGAAEILAAPWTISLLDSDTN